MKHIVTIKENFKSNCEVVGFIIFIVIFFSIGAIFTLIKHIFANQHGIKLTKNGNFDKRSKGYKQLYK